MVSVYGLNERVGNVSFYDSQGRESFTKPYSDDTAKMIDEEVSKLIESQYARALSILTENKDKLTLLAEKLLDSEVIFKEDLVSIFGKRQWGVEETPLLVDDSINEISQDVNSIEENTTENKVIPSLESLENLDKEESEEVSDSDVENTEQTK